MAKKMLPYLSKKGVELKAASDYYHDRITGDEFVEIMNRLVLLGERTGKHRGPGPDFTYSHGVLKSRMQGEKRRVSKRIIILPDEVAEGIKV